MNEPCETFIAKMNKVKRTTNYLEVFAQSLYYSIVQLHVMVWRSEEKRCGLHKTHVLLYVRIVDERNNVGNDFYNFTSVKEWQMRYDTLHNALTCMDEPTFFYSMPEITPIRQILDVYNMVPYKFVLYGDLCHEFAEWHVRSTDGGILNEHGRTSMSDRDRYFVTMGYALRTMYGEMLSAAERENAIDPRAIVNLDDGNEEAAIHRDQGTRSEILKGLLLALTQKFTCVDETLFAKFPNYKALQYNSHGFPISFQRVKNDERVSNNIAYLMQIRAVTENPAVTEANAYLDRDDETGAPFPWTHLYREMITLAVDLVTKYAINLANIITRNKVSCERTSENGVVVWKFPCNVEVEESALNLLDTMDGVVVERDLVTNRVTVIKLNDNHVLYFPSYKI